MANTKQKNKKKIAKAVWTNFREQNGKMAVDIDTTYFDKQSYINQTCKAVNDEVQDSLSPRLFLIKLLDEGKIKNLKITYDIYEDL